MKKKEFIKAVQENLEEEKGIVVSAVQAEKILNSVFTIIQQTLANNNESIGWPEFGKFSVVKSKERKGRKPATGESLIIKASLRPKFKPAEHFKAIMN